jgi:hypothetical protein
LVSRYSNREIVNNNSPRYKEVREERNIRVLRQFVTPVLKHPSAKEIRSLTVRHETWKVGSKLFKLAKKYYNNPRLWWIIAWYNQKPTEADFKIGDIVEIPTPLEQVLRILEV